VTTAQGVQRSPFPNNSIPQNQLDRVGQNLVNLYPNPNLPGIVNNLVYTPAQTTSANNWNLKVDQNFGPNDQGFFRYSRHAYQQLTPGALPAPAVGNTNAGATAFPLPQFVMSDTHTFAPRLINEARAGVGRLFHRCEAG
jgi:hypothetical protein